MAAHLVRDLGVQPGDRVILASQNCPQFVVAFYAILRARAVAVPVNPMSKAQEVRYCREDSGARVAFVAQELLARFEGFEHVIVHAYGDAIQGDPGRGDDEGGRGDPADLAVLPYTSGTTGHPKGCMHTHATVLASLAASAVWKGLHADTVVLAVAPLFHMLGLQNGMNMPLFLGGTAVMMSRWDAAQAARLIECHRVTAWTAPPAMVIDFFSNREAQARDLSSLALLSGGGAAMPEAVSTMLSQRYGLSYNEAYGLSETASFLFANPPARGKRQCLGIPTQGVEARILDSGELAVHGPQVMQGYWRNPEADRESFVDIDGKRFFRTGDLVSTDEDGYFFLRDRLKRMINVSGYKVWPAEVESAMYEHPAIHEACVVGVPDSRQGESVKALVVLKPGLSGEVAEDDIVGWARQRMAVYKAPRFVQIVDSLPKSGTGKILWRELQEAQRKEPAA
jgi:fatty-acyl-CoA synthase